MLKGKGENVSADKHGLRRSGGLILIMSNRERDGAQ